MQMHDNTYKKLLAMTVLSFASMYILMYAMVDQLANVIPNINQFYMAGLMAAPMVLIELVLMRHMYKDKKLNMIIMAASVLALAAFFICIRQQTGVSDKQFLKSMVPHHAAAILMCRKTEIENAEIKSLCDSIVTGQQQEIEQMKALLETME